EARAAQRGRALGSGREAELEVLADAEPREDAPVLGNEADAEAGDLVRRPPRQLHAGELDRASRGVQESPGRLPESRLAPSLSAPQRGPPPRPPPRSHARR